MKEFVTVHRSNNTKYFDSSVVLGLYGVTGAMRQAVEISETQALDLRDQLDSALARINATKRKR
jgi:hypothetical protein